MIGKVISNSVVPIYIKIFPVFFVYAETNKICINHTTAILQKLKEHSFFMQYESLFSRWQKRFTNILEERSAAATRSEMENRVADRTNNNEFSNLIGYADIEFFISVQKWLRFHKLHKYAYFFCNITFEEMMSINEHNILELDKKVNVFPITNGARGTIIRRMADEIHSRVSKLKKFIDVEYFDTDEKLMECLLYLKKVLHTPIKKYTTYTPNSENLPAILETVITNVVEIILERNRTTLNEHTERTVRVLQSAYSCYFFTHLQRSKFNTLRGRLRIVGNRANIEESKEAADCHVKIVPNLSEEEKLEINLNQMQIWLNRLMI